MQETYNKYSIFSFKRIIKTTGGAQWDQGSSIVSLSGSIQVSSFAVELFCFTCYCLCLYWNSTQDAEIELELCTSIRG